MDLFRRVRWGNVARAAALVTAVALIVAWPRLRAEPPSLPPEPAVAAPVTVREESAEFGVEPSVGEKPRPATKAGGGATSRGRRPAPRRGRTESRRRRPKPHSGGGATSGVPAPPVSPAPVRVPAWTPPQSEFGLGE